MRIITSLQEFENKEGTIVTIGSFDGVHKGHRQVLKQLSESAEQKNLTSVVITFEPHPQFVLNPNSDFFLISSYEQKIELLSKEKIDILFIIPFTKDFAKISSSEFIQNILVEKLNTKAIVMGPNHRFGNNREGNFDSSHDLCEKHKIEVIKINEYVLHEIAIRSTQIRKKIFLKEFDEVEELLGHHLFIKN
jgi:riboflavin kinase / FMN adenylyltransferase